MDVEAVTMPAEQQRRVWISNQIFWAAALGGVLGGLYLLSENYKALGYFQLAKKTFVMGLISSFILLMTFFCIPEASIIHFAPFLILTQCVLTGGYIIGEHYKQFYAWDVSKQILIYLPLLVFGILALPFYLPESLTANIPRFICALIPALCIQSLAKLQQDEPIKILIEKGRKKGSFGKLLGVISLAFLLQLGIVLIFIFLTELVINSH